MFFQKNTKLLLTLGLFSCLTLRANDRLVTSRYTSYTDAIIATNIAASPDLASLSSMPKNSRRQSAPTKDSYTVKTDSTLLAMSGSDSPTSKQLGNRQLERQAILDSQGITMVKADFAKAQHPLLQTAALPAIKAPAPRTRQDFIDPTGSELQTAPPRQTRQPGIARRPSAIVLFDDDFDAYPQAAATNPVVAEMLDIDSEPLRTTAKTTPVIAPVITAPVTSFTPPGQSIDSQDIYNVKPTAINQSSTINKAAAPDTNQIIAEMDTEINTTEDYEGFIPTPPFLAMPATPVFVPELKAQTEVETPVITAKFEPIITTQPVPSFSVPSFTAASSDSNDFTDNASSVNAITSVKSDDIIAVVDSASSDTEAPKSTDNTTLLPDVNLLLPDIEMGSESVPEVINSFNVNNSVEVNQSIDAIVNDAVNRLVHAVEDNDKNLAAEQSDKNSVVDSGVIKKIDQKLQNDKTPEPVADNSRLPQHLAVRFGKHTIDRVSYDKLVSQDSGIDQVNSQIERWLLEDALESRQLKITAADINHALERKVGSNDMEKMVAYADKIERETNHSFTEYCNQALWREIATSLLISHHMQINDTDLKRYYASNRDRYQQPEKVHLLQILVNPLQFGNNKRANAGIAEWKRAKEMAEQLEKQLNQGANFADLAKKHSHDSASAPVGGDLGFVSAEELQKPLADAAFKLSAGKIVVVKTLYGYHILKALGRQASRNAEYSEVAAAVRHDYENYLAQTQSELLLSRLRRQAIIDGRLEMASK